MVATPSNLTYGTINGKFYLTQLDSADVGREPDYAAASGTVTFTPTVNSYKNLAIPALFLTIPVQATIDSLGDLRDSQGALGVVLVATNNPDLVPKDWTYTVTINLVGATPLSFPLLVTGGANIDLAVVAPAATSSGTAVVVSSSDRILAQQAAAAAQQSADAAAASAASVGGGGGGGLNTEQVQDVVGTFISGGGYVSVVYDDTANTMVVSSTSALATALSNKQDATTAALKALVPSYRDKNETTGVWPARATGYHHDIARGTEPGPLDSVAGDERSIPR